MLPYIKNLLSRTSAIIASFCYKIGSNFLSFFGYLQPLVGTAINDELQAIRSERIELQSQNRRLQQHNNLLDGQKNTAEDACDLAQQQLRVAQQQLQHLGAERFELEASYRAATLVKDDLTAQLGRQQIRVAGLEYLHRANTRLVDEGRAELALARESEATSLALVQEKQIQLQAAHARAEDLAERNGMLLLQNQGMRAQLSRMYSRQAPDGTTASPVAGFRGSQRNRSFSTASGSLNVDASLLLGLRPMRYFQGMSGLTFRGRKYFQSLRSAAQLLPVNGPFMNACYHTQPTTDSLTEVAPYFKVPSKNHASFITYIPSNFALYAVPGCMFAVGYFNHDQDLSRYIAEVGVPFAQSIFKGLSSLPAQFSKLGFTFEFGGVMTPKFGGALPALVLFSVTTGNSKDITAAHKY